MLVPKATPLDLPDAGTAGDSCEDVTKGFVLHVDKCLWHDLWIHLHSLNKWEGVSTTQFTIDAGTYFQLDSKDYSRLSTQGFLETLTAGRALFQSGSKTHVQAPVILAGDDPEPKKDDRDALVQLHETTHSGIYLGNTDNPKLKALDWYEEGEYTPEFVNGDAKKIIGSFTRTGNRCTVDIHVVFRGPGSGVFSFSLPFPVRQYRSAVGSAFGVCNQFRVSGVVATGEEIGSYSQAMVWVSAYDRDSRTFDENGHASSFSEWSQGYASNITPGGWRQDETLSFSLTYECAPG